MTWVALTALAVALTAVASTGALLRSLARQHGRERQQLLDQICHLAGKTWTPPPAAEPWRPDPQPASTLVRSPDQMPDDFDWNAE